MQTVIIASGNKGKLKEFQELMKDLPVEVRSLADYPEIGDIEENGTTFAENAYIKAKAVYDATGSLAIADDSGLEVDALGGAPGIYSARYAGEEKSDAKNNAKLLAALEDVPEGERGAQFHCAIVAISADGRRFDAEGIVRGEILRAMRARKRVMRKTTPSSSRRLRMCRKANAARSSIARSSQFLPTAAASTQKASCVVRFCAQNAAKTASVTIRSFTCENLTRRRRSFRWTKRTRSATAAKPCARSWKY